jgi:hypothetical protein
MKTANSPLTDDWSVLSYGFFDDFTDFAPSASTGRWTSTSTNGTNAIYTSSTAPGAAGGVLQLIPSNATPAANDAAYLSGSNAVYQFAADQSIFLETMIYYTEINTNYANLYFGLASGTVTSLLVNGSAGPATSFYGAGIYKKGSATGTPVWSTISSFGSTQTLNTSKNASGVSSFVKLGISIQPAVGGTGLTAANQMTVSYFLNDKPLLQNVTAGSSYYPIKDTVSVTLPYTTYMYPVIGVKNGATITGGMETIYIDYVRVRQHRAPNTNSPD